MPGVHKLQTSLNELARWSDKWGMELHPDKCSVLHFGQNNPRNVYTINGIALVSSAEARDLGVTISDTLSPTQHVNNVARKAHGVLSQMKRTLTFRDSQIFPRIYRTSIVEFSVEAWCPSKVEDIYTLEKMQRRALRMITDQGDANYVSKLKKIGMTSLQDRRKRGDMIQVFKIMNDLSGLDKNNIFNFVRDRHSVDTRNHSANLLVPEKCRLNVRKNFFSCRIVNQWNSLPDVVRNSSNVNTFKNNYDEFMFTDDMPLLVQQ